MNNETERYELAMTSIIVCFVLVLCAIALWGCGGYPVYRQPPGMLSGEWTQYQWQQRIGNDPTPPPALVGDSSLDDNTRWKLQHAVW